MQIKKKFIILGIIFVVLILSLPFVIDALYNLGETYPLIVLSFTRAEMLSYISSILGLLIALLAIIISILQGQPKIEITKEIALIQDSDFNSLGNTFYTISVRNKSAIEVEIKNIGLISKNKLKGRKDCLIYIFNPLKHNLPRTLKGYSKETIVFDTEPLDDKLIEWGKNLKKQNLSLKTIYFVELSNGEYIKKRYKSDDLFLKQEEK